MERIAICPGSFDPITNGHLDIISRSSRIFDKLYVVVLNNETRQPLFTVQERVDLIKKVIKDFPNVEVDSYKGLLVDYARNVGAIANIRGLQFVSDFEFEVEINSINKLLNHEIETFFIMTRNNNRFISSHMIKEAAKNGSSITGLIPKEVEKELIQKLNRQAKNNDKCR